MKRRFTAREALDLVVATNSEHPGTCESEDEELTSEDEVEFALESDSDSSCSSDDSTESEDTEETADLQWNSKNGQILWSSTHTETLRYNPAKGMTPGPTHYATARITTLQSCFDLFITEEIIQLLLENTNLHGRRFVTDWIDFDSTDIQAYIGLLILAGVYKSRNESTRSLWDVENGRSIFRTTMSHRKFKLLSSTLRFDDRMTRPARYMHDKLAAFRTIWEKWTHRLPLLFNPGQDVCVDEQLVPFKGRCRFRQYMPSKPAKYGIKIWVTCDVTTSYAWKLQIYTGKSPGSPAEVNQGKRVILEMTEGLQGNTVTCDNFFTSYGLAEELLKRKMALVGTIRRNKPELPPQLLQIKHRALLSSLFAFTKTHTAVSYVPKRGKNVLLLSTKHREPAVSDTEKKKPVIITDYNRCKGGVDNLDKVCVIMLQLHTHLFLLHNAFIIQYFLYLYIQCCSFVKEGKNILFIFILTA